MKRVVIASELRVMNVDGAYFTASPFGHDYWTQVLGEECPTRLLVRAMECSSVPFGATRVDGPLVEVTPLPPLRPGYGLARELCEAVKTAWSVAGVREPTVLRAPGIVASILLLCMLLRRQPFAVQLVGDPLDVGMAAGVGGRFAPVVAAVLGTTTRLACRRASVVLYVTDQYLQARYPAGRGTPTFSASDVQLDCARPSSPVSIRTSGRRVRLVTVASMDQPYKRVDLLVEAVARLRAQGWEAAATVIGGGRGADELRLRALELGIADHVAFLGSITDRSRLRNLVSAADLFLLCSDTEGMPRALIEAMHDGVPCIGTRVGGIVELLPPYALAAPGSVDSIVAAVIRHIAIPELAERNRQHCLVRSQAFVPEVLAPRRRAFLKLVLSGGT